MLFQTALLALVASAPFAAAFPGGDHKPMETTCSAGMTLLLIDSPIGADPE